MTAVLQEQFLAVGMKLSATGQNPSPHINSQFDETDVEGEHLLNLLVGSLGANQMNSHAGFDAHSVMMLPDRLQLSCGFQNKSRSSLHRDRLAFRRSRPQPAYRKMLAALDGFRHAWRSGDLEAIATTAARLAKDRLASEPLLATFADVARRALERRSKTC
ncbi:MAG: hypothetical protein HYY25_12130 [Candidatus Wallbacteria bacterium]|nr:hypothetical protein [Candidatus Wallbacteria bacterium]